MATDFKSARFWAKEIIEDALYPGACVVDATMGNGYDTAWLCELVGESGTVYAFDIQQEAVENTAHRLEKAGLRDRASLHCIGHEHMLEVVDVQVDAVLFNLGWLPGAEHGVTTQTVTTLKAVEAALALLKEEAVMTICIYPGHEEGTNELLALQKWASQLDDKRYDVLLKRYLNQPNDPPQMLAIRKKKSKKK